MDLRKIKIKLSPNYLENGNILETDCNVKEVQKIKIQLKPFVKLENYHELTKKLEKEKEFHSIELVKYQIGHAERINTILDKYPLMLDLSMLGSGKTYTSSFISLNRKHNDVCDFKHVIVICPANIMSNWQKMKDVYGVPVKCIESYNTIRSTKCVQPKHGLLTRYDYTTVIKDKTGSNLRDKIVDKVDFKPTSKLLEMIDEGLLLVIDEIQNIKNLNASFGACKAIIESIIGDSGYGTTIPQTKSRAMLLSGSPIDKPEQVIHLFRLTNIMKSDDLSVYNPAYMVNEWRGFFDIVQFANTIGFNSREIQIPAVDTGSVKMFKPIAYTIFQKVIKPEISSAMNPKVKNEDKHIEIIKFNGLYNIENDDDFDLLTQGVEKLARVSNFNSGTETVEFGSDGLGTFHQIIRALVAIETAKISTMVRIGRQWLNNNLCGKLVICVNYTETLNDIAEGLRDFNPLILNGKVSHKRKAEIRDEFQGDNDSRLLIANLKVCSTGIDLDDKFGHRPRFCLISPNYSTIDLYQLCYRFLRMNTKSAPTIHIMYGRHACELPVLKALASKSKVMKETTEGQTEAGVVFPCDFPFFDELGELDQISTNLGLDF